MNKGDFLFVYGTLRVGQRADLSRNPNVMHVGQSRVNGTLHKLGWYPGMALPDKDSDSPFTDELPSVLGDVFEILDAGVTHGLDLYEGHPDFFNRTKRVDNTGRIVWVYRGPKGCSDRTLIESGDFADTLIAKIDAE